MNRFQTWYRGLPSAIRVLLTINVVAYVLWQVILIYIAPVNAFVLNHLALNPGLPDILLEPWQLVTYGFLHLSGGLGGFLHILFNMLWLVWIGRDYEEMHGSHRLMAIYLLGSVGGALVTVLLHNLLPGVPWFGGVVYGASASVLGVMMAVAITYPYKSIGLIFIGNVRLIYVVVGFLVLDILFLAGSNTAIAAHWGGALFGFLYAKGEGAGLDLSSWAAIFFRGRRRSPNRRYQQPSAEDAGFMARMEAWLQSRQAEKGNDAPLPNRPPTRSKQAPREAPQSSLDDEVDRILEKISEEGYESLTDEEKTTLYEASKR